MASLVDIGLAAAINILSAFIFLMLFAILRLQPIFDRVYFPKWYLKGIRSSPTHSRTLVRNIFNVDSRSYIRFLNWMPEALRMPQLELIEHAGLDSAVYIRIYLLGLKIFVPLTVLAFAVLVPVNWTGETLDHVTNLTFSDIDKISISNVPPGSKRFWAHLSMSYIFTFWTCYVLYNEYEIVASMRLRFLASEDRRPDQFTVVYNANHLANVVEKKMSLQNSLDYYEKKYIENPSKKPSTKTGFCGLWGRSVDAIEFYTAEIEKLTKEEDTEREKVVSDPKAIMPVAFVSFKSRWGAAVCAQTQQTSNPTIWLTDWAPEPRDVYWPNLSVPFVKLSIRRFLMAIALFFLTFFYIIPIAFVQSLANIEGIEKVFPFLKSVINGVVKSFIQGFLPGIALKIFLILLPTILMIMTKIEGHTSISALERRSAAKYYLFILVNVFLMNIITGTALQQLHNFINQSANEIPKTIGVSMPMKATFFITYIMVDGWAGVAAEIIRLKPLVMFQLKKWFLVKTDQDMKQATNPGSLDFSSSEPRIQLYFLLGLVYSVVTPFLLPFIVIFFGFSYVVFRHQIINVYHQQYESGAAFWPDVHRRIITGLVISHMLLIGLMSSKDFAESSAVLIALPILTIWFHTYCKSRFESAFVKFPLQDAMVKDTLERATEPTFNLKAYLQDAYVHPVFKDGYFERPTAIDEEESNPLVPTKRQSYRSTPAVSKYGSEISSEHEVGITL
ncbi:CSC1-like protein At4g02900 isoform X2 [Magnolia sinica]|uniref:CSC1-like protein At4g02900 isoform X2 n=1 Tax=Magnolia sinica TaxID=86752 RepID=UPI00265879D1|nr:CSC1-like protein At4g02900 isoform X2 [Magnolia sinica]